MAVRMRIPALNIEFEMAHPDACMALCCTDEGLQREAPKMTRTLIDIDADFLALLATLEEGEIGTPEAEAEFDRLMGAIADERSAKLDSCAAVVRELTLRAAARREEAERLAKRVRADEASLSWLKSRMMAVLDHAGLKRVETRRFKITVAGNGGLAPLDLPPVEELPDEYQRVTVAADTEAIRKALADGVSIKGVRVLPRGFHLRVS